MKFELTQHAEERIEERKLSNPNNIVLFIAKNNVRKRIIKSCKINGYNKNYIYWRNNDLKPSIYVCTLEGVNKYKVITAFKLNK